MAKATTKGSNKLYAVPTPDSYPGVFVDNYIDEKATERYKQWYPDFQGQRGYLVFQLAETVSEEALQEAAKRANRALTDEDRKQIGKRYLIFHEITFSFGDNSNLRKLMTQWAGRDFPKFQREIELDDFIGANATVGVGNKDSQDGTSTYAALKSLAPLTEKSLKRMGFDGLLTPVDYIRKQDRENTPKKIQAVLDSVE
jgi:hypothetical protein